MKDLKHKLNDLLPNNKHTLCKGDGIDNCGYYTKIDCMDCKYGGGRKNPEAKKNSY